MTLECDCGYVASGESRKALVEAAQAHARAVHRIELEAETILAIAGRRSIAADDRTT